MPSRPDVPELPRKRKEVAIFGAGIAGLTAAHELIERGYRVEVYEKAPASPVDLLMRERECDVGGKARTQWSRAERPDLRRHSSGMRATQRIVQFVRLRVGYDRAGRPIDLKKTVEQVATRLADAVWIHRLQVRGFSADKSHDPFPKPPLKRRPDLDHARAVAEELRKALERVGRRPCTVIEYGQDEAPSEHSLARIPDCEGERIDPASRQLLLCPVPMGLGLRDDWTAADEERTYVDFHVIEDWIPGEHGFRFFPSFYRNLFDTMRRTPIASEGNLYIETSSTVLDNVQPTKRQYIALDEASKSFSFPRGRVRSLESIFDGVVRTMASQGYTLADIVRGMTRVFQYMTSCPERRARDYENISWWDFVGGESFSEAFQKYFDATGQTLLAMRTKECDARTYGNITVQMLIDHVQEGQRVVDGTLNAPTSVAWFDHWRRYLERQGVEFRRGELLGFEVPDGTTLWPVVQLYEPEDDARRQPVPRGPQVVLARDFYVLAVGDVTAKELCERCPQLRGRDFDRLRAWDLGDNTRARPGGSHAHMSGIQYYFETDVEFIDGHIDYADAEWGLSSISQPQFWTRQRGWWSGYRGVLSVDVCDWFTPSRTTRRAAWDSTKWQIATEIWQQIRRTLPPYLEKRVPEPILYHLDNSIRFERLGDGDVYLPARNESPFLINRVGQYPRRPGEPDKYELYYGCLVFAGDFMQTYTRMTTMEATNESARHAVNAVLRADKDFEGDHCQVWNPEENEPEEVRYLVDLDRKMFSQGLPHFMDVLDWSPDDVWGALRHG
jgi:hypothetical protein